VARRERLHESSKDLRKINIVKDTIEEATNLQRIKEGNPAEWQKLRETHKVQENYVSVKDTIEEERDNPQNIRSGEPLFGYLKNPEHLVTTKLQENKGKNPVARRERLHESSKDLRKIKLVKNTTEGTMKKPEHKVTTNLQKIKEGNPVARQKLHETHKVQENDISVKDTIEDVKKPEHKVTTNLQKIKGKNPVARQKLHVIQENKISVKDTIEDLKKPEHKVTTNLQKIKEENPVARQKLHEINEISIKDTIEENKKNPEYKVVRNPQNNRRTVQQFKQRFLNDLKNNVKRERIVPEIQISRLRNREMRVERKKFKSKIK